MKTKSLDKKIEDVLIKMAAGFYYTETVEEFVPIKDESSSAEGSKLSLIKKKVSSHFVAPDMLAIKMLLDMRGKSSGELSSMTDEQLLELKNKLIKQLMEGKG